MAEILDGLSVSQKIKQEIKEEVTKIVQSGKKVPHLAAILVGENGASKAYVNSKVKDCKEVGFTSSLLKFPDTICENELLEEINKKAIENNKIINGLIEINVSKEESKTGIYIEDFKKDSEKYFSMSNVKIAGFMTMAPYEASQQEINSYFSNMRELKEEYQKKYNYVTELSMGMSNDYVEALKNGATIIRIGSKLFE